MTDGLIISVKEARKLLGKDSDSMSDGQVEELIVQLDDIARLTIRQYLREKAEATTWVSLLSHQAYE